MAVHLIAWHQQWFTSRTVFKCCHFEQQFFFQKIDQMHKVERNQEEHADF